MNNPKILAPVLVLVIFTGAYAILFHLIPALARENPEPVNPLPVHGEEAAMRVEFLTATGDPLDYEPIFVRLMDTQESLVFEERIVTDSDGVAVVEGLPLGEYKVYFKRKNGLAAEYECDTQPFARGAEKFRALWHTVLFD